MKPEVQAKVGDALVKLWSPIIYSFGIDEINIDNNDDRRKVLEAYPRIDDELWNNFVKTVKQKLGDVAYISAKDHSICIFLPKVNGFDKYFNIEINRESTENLNPINEFDSSEFDEMSKEEAMNYIEELYEIQESLPFEYAFSKIHAGSWFYIIFDCTKFLNEIESIREALFKTPKIYNEAIKAASIELQHKAEKQREIDERKKAKQEEETRILLDFASKIEPLLIDAGWYGKYRVSMNFNNYVLSLQLTSYDECRYESITQSDVIAKIGELVSFAKAYKTLKIAGGVPILHGDQVRAAEWRKIIDR